MDEPPGAHPRCAPIDHAGFLLIASLIGLVSYFIFLPSISQDSHIFLRAHASHLIHPLKTSIVLGLAALCVFTRSPVGWAIWVILLLIHGFQTFLIIRRAHQEHPIASRRTPVKEPSSSYSTCPGHRNRHRGLRRKGPVTLASGHDAGKYLDDRCPHQAEFHWNRLRGAENYPWGKGVIEAAKGRSTDHPILMICLTGHRSPSVAVTLRKLGFGSVYHLTWGLLYLILLEQRRKRRRPLLLREVPWELRPAER